MSFYKSFDPLQQKQNLCRGQSDIVSSDDRGQVKESGYVISDTQMTDLTHVIRTAAGLDAALAGKMNLVSPSTAGDIPQLDATGQAVDLGLRVDDTAAPASNILYSSQKLDSQYMQLVPAALSADVATYGAGGQVVDSGYKLDDTAAPAANILYSSLKLLTKVYLRASFDATVVAINATVNLPATVSIDPEATWSGLFFTAPRDGRYIVTAEMRVVDGQINGDRWYQLSIISPLGQRLNRIVFGAANAGTGDNDSLWVNDTDVVQLTAGQQVSFQFTNATGFVKTVDPAFSGFTISEQ
jgi:hypothetical protein